MPAYSACMDLPVECVRALELASVLILVDDACCGVVIIAAVEVDDDDAVTMPLVPEATADEVEHDVVVKLVAGDTPPGFV